MRTFIFCIMMFCSILSQAQERVSDVYFDKLQNVIPVGAITGFHSYNGVDYMTIENDSLQIFELESGTFNLKHIVQKPSEFTFNIFGEITNNSSRKNIEGRYYYSFFRSGVLIIDLVDGSIYRSKDISQQNYRLYNVIKKTDDQIYFYGFYGESERGYFRYDITEDEMYLLNVPLQLYYNIELIEHTVYYNNDSLSSIMGYDMFNDSIFVKYQYQGSLISEMVWRFNLGDKYLTFRDENGFKIINKNHEIIEFECSVGDMSELSILALRGNRYILAIKKTGEDLIQVFNRDDCELLHEINIEDDAYSYTNQFYINDNLVEEYTIIGYYGHYFGYGLGIIIDHISNTESYAFDYDFVFPHAALETENAVYWIGYDEIELSPSYNYVMRFDKVSGNVSSISPFEQRVYSSSIGISNENEIYFAANDIENNYNIWKTIDGNQFTIVNELDFRHNLGVYSRSDIRVDGESVVSNGVGGLMITNEKTDVISSGEYKRDVAITENYIATVITLENGNYVLKYDKQSGTSSKIFINAAESYQFNPVITDRFIFNTHQYERLYFDIENEQLKSLTQNAPSISIEPSKYFPSRDKMMITEYTSFNQPQNYFQFDFETEVLKKLDYELTKSSNWAITDKNVFYIDNSKLSYPSEEITKIDDINAPELIFSGDCSEINMSNNPTIQTGEFAELFFNCGDEILIVSDSPDLTIQSFLPHEGNFNFRNNVLHEHKDEYLLKTLVNGQNKYILFNAPNTFKEVIVDSEEYIVTTSFDNVDPLIITANVDEKMLNFYLLDKESGDMSLAMQYVYDSKYAPLFLYHPHAVSNTKYVATVSNESVGYELFEIDLESQTFEVKVDFYEGKRSSRPDNYTRTTEYLYFIAELEKDGRQWFRIRSDDLTNNDGIKVESLQGLKIFPNPAREYITFDKELESYSIYDIDGREVLRKTDNLQSNINIKYLRNGQYFISGKDRRGIFYSSKFMKFE